MIVIEIGTDLDGSRDEVSPRPHLLYRLTKAANGFLRLRCRQ
jgi:hypothetical protein